MMRGAAGLFWPFYFMEPSYVGSTFHYLVDAPDAGDVLHQLVPELKKSDGIHDVACKTMQASADAMVKLLAKMARGEKLKVYPQKHSGKNFLESDFKPEHLRVIYDVFKNDMAAQYLSGKLKSKKPNLVRQF